MADSVEVCWLQHSESLENALKTTLGISGQLIKRHFSAKEKERPVSRGDVSRLPLNLVNHLQIFPEYQGPEVKILLETQDYLVLHKPPGAHCHPLNYGDKDTLLNFLICAGKWEATMVNVRNYDRGLLYRLDYETSGVIMLAKTETFLQHMRGNFAAIMKKKFYWAIVEGDFDREGRWVHFLKGIGPKGIRQRVLDHQDAEAREGVLSVLKVTHSRGLSLVLVNLNTGLRHQIRAQLSHLGFPILGDELYGGKKARRLFLHALRYEFSEVVEDADAELFQIFFDLHRALQVSHDMLGRF